MEAVPPPELPPTPEISPGIPTPILAPAIPVEVPKPPAKMDMKHDFEDLIAVLVELSANGNSRPRFGTVSRLLKDRKPDAFESVGVTQFKSFLQLAESAGIVTVEHLQGQGGDGWLALRLQRSANSITPPQPAPSQHAKSRFRDLIKVLNDLRLVEDPEPKFRAVARQLGKIPSVYENAKVTRFKEYVEAAVGAGVVTVRGVKNGDGWFKLCPAYCNPPVHPSTSASTSSAPSTRAACTTSPFAPLVDFLKSKQSTSAQPIPFSDVFAHLISTLGYPGLVSLYTSVPCVTTFGQYIDAAIAAGPVSLVSGTTASRDALISLRDTKPVLGVGQRSPDNPSPPVQPVTSTTPLPSVPSSQGNPVSPPSANITPNSFQDLVAVLKELRTSTGESESRFSSVVPLLLKRRPNAYASAGVMKFTEYIVLAMEKGVVRARGMKQGDGWVSLSDPGPGELKSTPAVSQSSNSSKDGTVATQPLPVGWKGGGVDPKFVDLVETMGEMWKNGEAKPLSSFVGSQLLKDEGRKARTLAACGVDKFTAYTELAKDAGIIKIYYERLGERILLDPTIRAKAGYT